MSHHGLNGMLDRRRLQRLVDMHTTRVFWNSADADMVPFLDDFLMVSFLIRIPMCAVETCITCVSSVHCKQSVGLRKASLRVRVSSLGAGVFCSGSQPVVGDVVTIIADCVSKNAMCISANGKVKFAAGPGGGVLAEYYTSLIPKPGGGDAGGCWQENPTHSASAEVVPTDRRDSTLQLVHDVVFFF